MSGRRRRTMQRSDAVLDTEINNFERSNFVDIECSARINFSDVEHLIKKFSGDGGINVKAWLEEFEMYADTFRLNSVQKFILCKRSLTGSAKLFIECESKPVSYNSLKDALYKEFSTKLNSADVHRLLRTRKKKDGIDDIASQATVDEASIISYVIDGIKDSSNNKMVLYGARNITELKEKFAI